jgi:DNA-binding NtrC family response regulator
MNYIFKQKLQLADLASLDRAPKRILIFEPEQYLSALYGHYLARHNFDIKHCTELGELRKLLLNFNPELLVLSLDNTELLPKVSQMPRRLVNEFPSLKVISTSYNLNNESIGELMRSGVVSHINRRLSRPQDLVAIVKTILE